MSSAGASGRFCSSIGTVFKIKSGVVTVSRAEIQISVITSSQVSIDESMNIPVVAGRATTEVANKAATIVLDIILKVVLGPKSL